VSIIAGKSEDVNNTPMGAMQVKIALDNGWKENYSV